MNRQIRLVGIAMLCLFTVLFAQLNYLDVVRATSLDHNPRTFGTSRTARLTARKTFTAALCGSSSTSSVTISSHTAM